MTTYMFLRPARDPLPPSLANTPDRFMTHNSFIVGDRIIKPNIDSTIESGYQASTLLAFSYLLGSIITLPFLN